MDKLDQLYDALSSDGAEVGTREQFRDYMLRPGDEGYRNRLKFYKAMKEDGAEVGASYEDFRDWMFGKRVAQQATQGPSRGDGTPNGGQSGTAALHTTRGTGGAAPSSTGEAAPGGAARATEAPEPAAEPKAEAAEPKAAGWRPSPLQMAALGRSVSRFNDRMNAQREQVHRMTGSMTPGGRKRAAAGEMAARMAGTPWRVLGVTKPVAGGGTGTGGAVPSGTRAEVRQGAVPYGVVTVDGESKTQWLLPDGSLTTDLSVADQAEYAARQGRLWGEFKGRMVENGLNPDEAGDVYEQSMRDLFSRVDPDNAAEQVWAMADEEAREDLKTQMESGSSFSRIMRMLSGASNVTGGLGTENVEVGIKARAASMRHHNLRNMADDAWLLMGKEKQEAIVYDIAGRLRAADPKASDEEIMDKAVRIALEYNDRRMAELAVKKNEPAGVVDFFLRKAIGANAISSLMDAAARVQAGTSGDMAARDEAMARYENGGHRVAGIAGTVTGMLIDPLVFVSAGVGGAAVKGAAWGLGRAAGTTLLGRIGMGAVGGAANFTTFEAGGEFLNQARYGEFSGGKIGERAVHGLLLGLATGVVAPMVGNVSDKLVKATRSTAGKLGLRAAELGVSTVAEGTIFSVPEWIEGGRDAMDVWTDNLAMIAGFNLLHGIKSAPRVISELRAKDNPANMAERNHNRMGFEGRLRKALDGRSDLALTADEKRELELGGYTDLNELVAEYGRYIDKKEQREAARGKSGVVSPDRLVEAGELPDGITRELPYNRFAQLMSDGAISEAARAKMYYYLTGRTLPMSTVVGSSGVIENKDGSGKVESYTVQSWGANGVITSRTFGSRGAAEAEVERIDRQAELNVVDTGERYYDGKAEQSRMWAACERMSKETGAPTRILYEMMKKNPDEMSPEQLRWAERINELYDGLGDAENGSSALREELNGEFGVDVDAAIKKEPGRRSAAEQSAVKEYARRLYGVEEPSRGDGTPDEAMDDGGGAGGAAPSSTEATLHITSLIESGDDVTTRGMSEARRRGYMADARGRRDIAIEVADPNNADNSDVQEAWDGVVERIEDEAAAMAAERREAAKQLRHTDGSYRVAVLKERGADDEEQLVYIIDGNVVMAADGLGVDASASDNVVVVVNPATGERKQIDPSSSTGISRLGLVTSGEDFDAAIEADRAEYVRAMIEAAREPQQGGGTTGAGEPGEAPGTGGTGLTSGAGGTGGARFVAGEPSEYVEGVEITILDENGTERPAMVMGRVRYDAENGEFVPDAEGNIVEFLMNGEAYHEHIHNMPDRVVSHVEAVAEAPSRGDVTPDEGRQSGAAALHTTPLNGGGGAAPSTTGTEPVPVADAMPVGADGKKDYRAAGSERTMRHIYDELGISPANADKVVSNNIKAAEEALKKTRKAAEKVGDKITDPDEMAQAERQAREAVEAAEATKAFWEEVQSRRRGVVEAERERSRAAEAEREAAEREKALREEAERQAAIEAERAEQAERGAHAVHPAIREKWEAAPKVEGYENEITLPNGERVKGRYVLVESGAATASHNANMDFARSEGFPVDENGNTINDRDYERDKSAQDVTREMGRTYDSRALQDVPVVSREGVVLSGNGRTMAGEMAAQDNTDGAYIEHLKKYGQQFGFTPEQVGTMEHPRVVFVPDADMSYTSETFAKFNAQQMKSQSRVEQAVKLGKTVDDSTFGRIIDSINEFDTLSDFYGAEAASRAIGDLRDAGVINAMQYAEMFDGDKVSAVGRQLLESALIGKAFEGNPEAVRQLSEYPAMRQRVVAALGAVVNNVKYGDGFSLEEELAEAINLAYQALSSGGKKQGEPVSDYARQLELFPFDLGRGSVSDFTNATIMLLGDLLNHGEVNKLKKVLALYNLQASSSSSGQLDLFSGGIVGKEEILKSVLEFLRYGTDKEKQSALAAAAEQRRGTSGESGGESAGAQQVGVAGGGDERGATAGGNKQSEKPVSDTVGLIDPRTMSDEERQRRGDMLRSANAIEVAPNQIVATKDKSARKAAEEWWDENVGEPHWYDTEAGEVEINRNSIEDSLAHGYGQMKLDAITSLVDGFGNAVYLGTMPDGTRQEGVQNHYFAYPITYNGKRCYVFCRALHDNNTNRLYVHEVFVEENIIKKKGNALQTAASQPHGGVALYRDILANVLDVEDDVVSGGKVSESSSDVQEETEKVAKNQTPNAVQAALAAAEQETNIEPTEAQKEAGNYKKGHIKLDGFDISIENPKGSIRSGKDASGKEWSVTMQNTYGYIRGTEGVDGDHIDVFLSDNMDDWNGTVYVIDQVKADGSFDEHKVMYGFNSAEEAAAAYNSNYSEGWQGLGTITGVSKEEFKKWIGSSHRKTKPFADYKKVKTEEGQAQEREKYDPRDYVGRTFVSIDSPARLTIQSIDFNDQAVIEGVTVDGETSHQKVKLGVVSMIINNGNYRLQENDSRDISTPTPAERAVAEQDDIPSKIEELRAKHPDALFLVRGQRLYKAYGEDAKKLGEILGVEVKPDKKYGFVASFDHNDLDTNLPKLVRAGLRVAITDTSVLKGDKPASRSKKTENEQETSPTNRESNNESSAGVQQGAEASDSSLSDGQSANYTVEPAQYTTKRGKVLDMHLVTFGRELSKEERQALTKFAKDNKGWWDREKGGFMMRDEASARALGEMLGDGESIADNQPLSLADVRAVNDAVPGSAGEAGGQIGVAALHTTRGAGGAAPSETVDAQQPANEGKPRREPSHKQPKEVNLESLMGELHERGEAKFSDHIEEQQQEESTGRPKREEPKGEEPEAKSKWVNDEDAERFEELRQRLKKKLGGQANMGVDPEILTIGIEMGYLMLKKGARKFAEFAKGMIDALGDGVRPYIKAFYNGARDLPELSEIERELTPYDEVRGFDVMNFDKEGAKDLIATAEHVVREEQVEQEAKEATGKVVGRRNAERKKSVGKGGGSEKKSVTSQRQPSLFDVDEEQPIKSSSDEQEEVHVRSGAGPAEREGGHQRGQDEPLGAGEQHEDARVDAGGVVRRGGGDTVSDATGGSRVSKLPDGEQRLKPSRAEPAPLAESERKNTHNNHAERGTDYAPKGTSARIEANIKAIETMQRLIESGEPATPEDMSVLRKFSGWGGLGAAFKEKVSSGDSGYNPRLRDDYQPANPINARLRELLSPEAYEAANMSRNTAYYTPAPIIDAMWDVARAMGFRGGNVLEGSAGIGKVLGLMPTDMSERSNIQAIEVDETTGNILKLLYPDAKVDVKGFEKTYIPNGSVDLAITNVPFGDILVKDETGDKDLSKKFRAIHDFCIAKNVRKLKEGGIGIFITSSGTLDSPNSAKLRNWIVNEGNADVVGAFRMHRDTFGGAGVTSDIIVIRKRVNGRKSANAIDVSGTLPIRTVKYNTGETKRGSGEVIIKDLALDVNKHFVEHPEDMAGEMAFAFEKGGTYRATSKGLYPSERINQEQRLSEWARQFEAMDWDKAEERESQQVVYEDLGEDVKEGSMLLDSEGNLCLAQRGKAVPINVNANKVKGHTKAECFNAYKAIKDALADVLEYQTAHSDDNGLQQRLAVLNEAYDSFVETYGHLNKNTSIAFLRSDIDYPGIAALESVSETGDKSGKRIVTYGKTDIFSRRVVETESEPKPTTIKDGIIASIYLNGRVDVPYIAKQLSMSDGEVRQRIIESGLGFENPTTTEMEVSYEYLSGNVREKLRQAKENNMDGRYDANIKALERVIPMNIPAHLIEFTLGSSWIEPKLYEDYVRERTGLDVKLTNAGGTWIMSEPYWTRTEQNKAMGVISEKCDKTILGHELIEAAITCKSISVTKTVSTGYGSSKTTETIVDKEATMACANKIDEIRQDFRDWARGKMQSDPEMSERMERVYNELFNNSVPKEIPDDFVPAHFGGAATVVGGKPFKLRSHQAKAVIRATTQALMLAHEVGTGKTYTLISIAMEMRRLGTARKPMIVVQNATVGQFVASAKALYPNAKILTLEDADRNAEGRRNFYAKIRYNDWDMIVVPQSVFERIPDSEERQIRFIEDKVEEKMMVLEKMREAANDDRDPVLRQAQRELDQLNDELNDLKLALQERKVGGKTEKDEKREAKTRQNAMVKAQEMLDREVDDVANFDDMGIDALLIDEAHEYKHLGFATAMQRGVKGVDPSYSKKSQGVYLKTQAVLEMNNGKNVVFATGTPISNTAAEIWTFMRYLMPADVMREYGIYYFDDFVRNFGNIQQMLEFATNGKYKENNRFAGYVNLPELVRIWSSVADTVLTREAGGVSDKIPEMEGGKAQDIYLPQTHALRGVMKFVKAELDRYENMSGKEKKENSHIPLTMYGITKAAAVDARLVLEDAADEPNSKTNEAVRQTLRSLEDSKEYNGTVAIFADNYHNKATGFNLYEDIRQKLIAAGVPEAQIVVMKSGMSIKKKLEIFDRVNRGEVRVIMGSTFTLGTGVNIQERLHTLIHVDAPNRPMDYTQRNGRILRQGNLHKEWGIPVRVLRFGVEDSLDVTAYQRLKTKGAIADSIMEGKKMMSNSMENRVLEEEQDLFGDITAQLSGSQYALLKNQVEKEVRKLEARKKQWEADQTYVHNQIPRLKGLIKDSEERAQRNREALAKVEASTIAGITIGKRTFASLDAMSDFIKEYNSKQREQQEQVRSASGFNAEAKSDLTVSVGGFDFHIHRVISKEQKHEKGQLSLSFSARTQMTYSCPELGLEDVPVDGQRLKSALEDILNNVLTGDDFREVAENAESASERYKGELQQVEARDGKPFEYADELRQAREKLAEYEELMKAEMAEKEAKYAEIDATVEAAEGIVGIEEEEAEAEETTRYRIREEAAPKKTGVGYKVFVLKDGKLYPPMVANPGGEATPVGVWLDADAAPVAGLSKTGRPQVKAGGKGTQGGSGRLAYRPGWHLGEIPYASQFNRLNPETGERELFPANFVWAEVEYANDVDYQEEAMSYGMNARGKFQHSLAGLPRLPENGSYRYRTNPDPNTDPWIITGAMKVNRILKPSEVDAMVEAAGREPQQRQAGAITDEQVEVLNANVTRAMQEDRDMMRRAVEQAAAKLGAPVDVYVTSEEVTHSDAEEQARRRRAKGWWDPKTGRIGIVLGNHRDVDDALATMGHETVAHYGLREMIGAERYNEFLDEVYAHLNDELKARVDERAGRAFIDGLDGGVTGGGGQSGAAALHTTPFSKRHGRSAHDSAALHTTRGAGRGRSYESHRREQVDELFGELAQKSFEEFSEGERTLWQRLKRWVRDLLDRFLGSLRLPKWFRLGDNELRYMLWRSKERMERGKEDPIELARDIVKRDELGLDGETRYSNDKKTTSSERDGAVSGNPSTEGLPQGGSAHLSRNPHAQPLDAAKVRQNTEVTMRSIKKILNKGEILDGKRAIETESQAVRALGNALHLDRADSSQSYYGDFYEGDLIAGDQTVRVRISTHPANGARIGNAPTDDKVSIVIRKNGEHFSSGEHGGYIEYIYEPGEISPADAANAIVKGVERLIVTGEFVDESGKAHREDYPRVENGVTLYRPGDDETGDIWRDGSLGMTERLTSAKVLLSSRHEGDRGLRMDALRAIGGNLRELLSATSVQRRYDVSTVKRVVDLARVLLGSGMLNKPTEYEVSRLLSAVKNSVGRKDIEGSVDKVLDIMIGNQLRGAEAMLRELEGMKAVRVDDRGVRVQGRLDAFGAGVLETFKKSRHWSEKDIADAIAVRLNRMGSADAAVSDAAMMEHAGLELALEYVQEVQSSKAEESELRDALRELRESTPEADRRGNAYREQVSTIEAAIRTNKAERVESYYRLMEHLGAGVSESMERARQWREAQKARVAEIHHNANSDMEGVSAAEHGVERSRMKSTLLGLNNLLGKTLFAPLATYMEMLRLFGRKSFSGEGYLFDRFGRGWIAARQKELLGVREKFARLDAKAAELFGSEGVKSWGDLIRWSGKRPGGSVSFMNGGKKEERELGQGHLLYIYMVNKMIDGQMKLRRMGVSEEDVAAIEAALDPRLIELADWLQEEFLVETRNEYNETHKRVFGASMAAVEHYFPLRILGNARVDKAEDLDTPEYSDGISSVTGAIIKRRRNMLALDITGSDALSVILDHVAQMEHWNAFAEFNRDLNTLRTYKHFRNQVENMTTIYGNGKELWRKFNDLCQVAVGSYRPKQSDLDKGAVAFAQGVTSAKVSFRIHTALKQLLSLPAFMNQARIDDFLGCILKPWEAWSWCIDNLPLFNERWSSRTSGDPRLLKSKMDWRDWRANIVQKAARVGMLPNAFVDALTAGMGAHAVYKSARRRYLGEGFGEALAERKARADAEIAYNQTQQSSEGAFLSTMQVDRTWLSVMWSIFRNASMGYQRRLHDSLRLLNNNLTPSAYSENFEFEKKKLMREGLEEEQAERAARRRFRRAVLTSLVGVGLYGWLLQFLWNLGGSAYYLLTGDDEDEKSKMWDDIAAKSAFGSVEGLTGGDLMSEAGRMWLTGEGNPAYLSKDMPLTSDLLGILKKLGTTRQGEALTDMLNIVVSSGIGMNPQSVSDAVLGILDACGDDPSLGHEGALVVGRIISAPQSQLDKLYFDEVGLSGSEVSEYTPKELAARYARWKVKRGYLVSPWTWGDEAVLGKHEKKAEKLIKERMERLGDAAVNEAYERYAEVYSGVDAQVKASKKAAKTDYVEAARLMEAAQADAAAYRTYGLFKQFDGGLDKIAKGYLEAESAAEAQKCHEALIEYKSSMVEVLGSEPGSEAFNAAVERMGEIVAGL